jgi:hypothetical protein
MWKHKVHPDRPQTIWRMRIACWIHKANSTHTEYVTLTAFSRQVLLREHATMLHLYVHCQSCFRNSAQRVLCVKRVKENGRNVVIVVGYKSQGQK